MTKDTWTYTDTVTFSVKGPGGEAVPNGEVVVHHDVNKVSRCVNNGVAEISASELVSGLGLTLDQETEIIVNYAPGSGSNYEPTSEQTLRITVNKGVLTRVEMTGYTGYEYGKPASDFRISNVSEGAKVQKTFFRDAAGDDLTGNFEGKAYVLWINLACTDNYVFPENPDDLTVTLDGKAAKVEDGFYVFQLDKLVPTYHIKYTLNGGTMSGAPETYTENSADITLPQPTMAGYRFAGWTGTDLTEKTLEVTIPTGSTGDRDYTANWERIRYFTVSYNVHDHGTAPNDEKVESGKTAAKPEDPTADGWKFKGWYISDDYIGEPFDFTTAITENTTLHAKWARTWTVTFDSNGHGTAPASQTVELNGKATKPADPTAEGYVFRGWYTTAACTTEFDFNTPIAADTTLYAKWNETYTVTFNVGRHGMAPTAQTVENGGKATKPENPTAKGWRFDGWYTDERYTARYDFDKAVTANTTLYAKWTQLFTLTFETNGGTKIDSVEAPDGSLVYLGSYKPTKSGYYFVGWYTDKNLTRESRVGYVRMDGNKTVYAKFAVADKTNPKTADPALPGLALAVLSFSTVGLAALGIQKRK